MSSVERRIRVVIVEDEPEARQSLRDYAIGISQIDMVGEAVDGSEAVELIDRLAPDLVFLDVVLPECSGLEVLARLRHRPEIVFTTAYDRFALAAFEAGALDYLLKPFGRDRFTRTVARVWRHLGHDPSPAIERAQEAFESPWRRLFARTPKGIVPIDVATIRRIAASGDYAEVHCESGRYLLHISLGELMARLDPDVFCQVHRSHIVNLDHVERMYAHDERRLMIELRGGDRVVASRSASDKLRRLSR